MHGIFSTIGNPPSEIERFRTANAAKRAYAEGLTDPKWREAFLRWCNYVDRQIEKSVVAYAERDERSARYWEKDRERQARAEALLAENPPH